jgi:hypothetical protein
MPANLSPTKPDKTRQIEENPIAPQLSQQQENAVDLLLQGKNDGEVAEAVGVTRQTVNTWKNHDAAFIATLNTRRKDLWEAQASRLRGLVGKAVDVLEETLGYKGDPKVRQAAAVHILRTVGLYGADLTPTGPATEKDADKQIRRKAGDIAWDW